MKPFDFPMELMQFFIDRPYLFPNNNVSDVEYGEWVIKNRCINGGMVFLNVLAAPLIEDFKNNIAQTYSGIANNGNFVFTTWFQMSKYEHFHMTYFPFEEKIAGTPYFRLKDNSLFPIWLQKLEKYRIKAADKQLGFAGFQQ